jgi:hypothetical protein
LGDAFTVKIFPPVVTAALLVLAVAFLAVGIGCSPFRFDRPPDS